MSVMYLCVKVAIYTGPLSFMRDGQRNKKLTSNAEASVPVPDIIPASQNTMNLLSGNFFVCLKNRYRCFQLHSFESLSINSRKQTETKVIIKSNKLASESEMKNFKSR